MFVSFFKDINEYQQIYYNNITYIVNIKSKLIDTFKQQKLTVTNSQTRDRTRNTVRRHRETTPILSCVFVVNLSMNASHVTMNVHTGDTMTTRKLLHNGNFPRRVGRTEGVVTGNGVSYLPCLFIMDLFIFSNLNYY